MPCPPLGDLPNLGIKLGSLALQSDSLSAELPGKPPKKEKLCPTLCNPMKCSLPSSCVHGILHARILEWVAIPFSRGSSQHRDQTLISHLAGRFFTIWATTEVQLIRYSVSKRLLKTFLLITQWAPDSWNECQPDTTARSWKPFCLESTGEFCGGLWGLEVLPSVQFRSVQSLSRVQLFATPWIAARQASLSITNSWSSLKLMSIE